jgi:toxin CcdB
VEQQHPDPLMAQFDVHPVQAGAPRSVRFQVVLQSDMLAASDTCVVGALVALTGKTAVKRLNPMFRVGKERVMFDPTLIATVSRRSLGPHVANLSQHRDGIIAALDLVFTGF